MQKNRTVWLLMLLLWSAVSAGTMSAGQLPPSKKAYPGPKQYIYRLTLRDKADTPYSLDHPGRWLSHKSVERRKRQGLQLDSTDLPVSPRYLRELRSHKQAHIVGQSRWNNTVLVCSPDTMLLSQLSTLPFVAKGELVWVSPDSLEYKRENWDVRNKFNAWDSIHDERYGNGQEQIEMLQGQRLHDSGFRAKGMTIAVLDGGFRNADRIPALRHAHIAGFHDFIPPVAMSVPDGSAVRTPDSDTDGRADGTTLFRAAEHGTKVLSVMAANVPEVLVGTAPEARYWLLRCEDQSSEQPVEEDYWTMAAEFADSAGVDIINSSLGYNDYDQPHHDYRLRDLDGNSSLISRTASMLARKGIILVNSAGNTGMGPWKKLCVPADAHEMLTVGAVNAEGQNAPFSAVGPTQDGRVKPDVVALGSATTVLSGRGSLIHDMGTSFSTPVVAGLVACLWQALPQKSALDIISLVRKTSGNAQSPDNIYGYGLPDFWQAYMVGKLE